MVFAAKFPEELMGLSYLLEITAPAVVVGWTTIQSNRATPAGRRGIESVRGMTHVPVTIDPEEIILHY